MRRTKQRLHRAVTRLALVATAGVMFQTAGCGVSPQELAAALTDMFVETVVTDFVQHQLGVTSTFSF